MKWLLMLGVFVAGIFYLMNQRKQEAILAEKLRQAKTEEIKLADPTLPTEQPKSTVLKFSQSTLGTLKSMTSDSNEKVRLASAELIWQIQDPDAAAIIKGMFETETEPSAKKQLIEMLQKDKNRMSLELISEALKDSDKDVRIAAVDAIGNYNTKEAIPALNRALKDYDEEVRLKALKAVDNIRKAIEDLKKQQLQALEEQQRQGQINRNPEDIKVE